MANLSISLSEILSVFATLKVPRTIMANSCINSSRSLKQNKSLKLLNGIALLLVTEETSDMGAATCTTHAEDGRIVTRFHVVKNRECTSQERRYYEEFIKCLNNADASIMGEALLKLVLDNCRAKILNRAIKLQKAVKEYKNNTSGPTWGESDDTMREDIEMFKELYSPSTVHETWSDYLDDFFMEGLSPQNFQTTVTGLPLLQAYVFASTESLINSINSPIVMRRLKKLGDYNASLMRIKKLAIRERSKGMFELNILPSPPRTILPSIPSPLTLMNRCAREMKLDDFSLKDLKNAAPTVKEKDIQSARPPTEAFVHCECALAVAMQSVTQAKLEIGVSKDCCWPCLEFLGRLSSPSGNIVVSATHGKIYHSWLCPNVQSDIYNHVETTARIEFASWIMSLNGRRKSDSHVASSSDDSDDEEKSEVKGLIRTLLNEQK